jgi:hypothetical protein
LINLNEEIQRLEELLKSTSEKQSKHSDLLSSTLHAFRVFHEIQEYELGFYHSELKELVVLPVTSALMTPLPPSYNLCATNCAKELTSPLEEGLSVSQPTKAIRPCSVCSILLKMPQMP